MDSTLDLAPDRTHQLEVKLIPGLPRIALNQSDIRDKTLKKLLKLKTETDKRLCSSPPYRRQVSNSIT